MDYPVGEKTRSGINRARLPARPSRVFHMACALPAQRGGLLPRGGAAGFDDGLRILNVRIRLAVMAVELERMARALRAAIRLPPR